MRSCSRSAAGVCATVRLGFDGLPDSVGPGVWKRDMSPQADSARPAHSTRGAAQRRRDFCPICRSEVPDTSRTSFWFALVRPEQFELPRPKQFNPWTGPRFDETTNPNPSILEGLRRDARRLEGR